MILCDHNYVKHYVKKQLVLPRKWGDKKITKHLEMD
jgi:hypothetical protein